MSQPSPTASPKDFSVLIVDDDPSISDFLTLYFSEKGIHVMTAPDGRAGLLALETTTPDLLILDVMMPHMTGHELLKAIRSDVRLKEVPVIMLTSQQGQKDINQAFDTGIIDYVIKPFKPEHLIVKVENILAATRKSILIVEHDEQVRQQLEIIYKDQGFQVTLCASGREAWSIVEQGTPDLIVIDWLLPKMEALSLLKNLQNESKLQSIPVIVLADKDEADQADLPRHDRIARPFIPRDLLKRSLALLQ